LNDKNSVRKTKRVEQQPEWEERHRDDVGGPLAGNASGLPDRSSELAEGSAGAVDPVHGSGFQAPADSVHPDFPVAGDDAGVSEDDVRRRAYAIWEQEGFPEHGHERHWQQAERELRGSRS
jgi:hypothetical protein